MRRNHKIAVIVAIAGLSLTAAYASYDWSSYLSEGETITSEWTVDPSGNKKVTVTINRGPYVAATDSIQVDASVVAPDPGAMTGIWIETCTDTNGDDYIDDTEWTTVTTGSVSTSGQTTTATIPQFTMTVGTFDGYRLRYGWTGGGEGMEYMLAPGLELRLDE